MGCLKLPYYEKEDRPNFLGLWKKSDGSKKCNDYYPFGLTFNSYSRENSTSNKYLYNQGTGEKTFKTERVVELELNVDQSKYRTYDYITGRWWQIDPKASEGELVNWNPYNYSFNNPIRYNDPEGDCPPDTYCPPEDPIEVMTGAIAATVSDGIKGLGNIILAPFGKELSNEGDGITLTMQERKAPETVGEAILKPVENALNASSVLPSSGPTQMLLTKTGPAVNNTLADVVGSVSKKLQGADLAKANGGNRVTIRSEKVKVEADVAGDAHFSKETQKYVQTPHVKISNRNYKAPNQPKYNTKKVEPVAMNQQQIRMIRKYIESLEKK